MPTYPTNIHFSFCKSLIRTTSSILQYYSNPRIRILIYFCTTNITFHYFVFHFYSFRAPPVNPPMKYRLESANNARYGRNSNVPIAKSYPIFLTT